MGVTSTCRQATPTRSSLLLVSVVSCTGQTPGMYTQETSQLRAARRIGPRTELDLQEIYGRIAMDPSEAMARDMGGVSLEEAQAAQQAVHVPDAASGSANEAAAHSGIAPHKAGPGRTANGKQAAGGAFRAPNPFPPRPPGLPLTGQTPHRPYAPPDDYLVPQQPPPPLTYPVQPSQSPDYSYEARWRRRSHGALLGFCSNCPIMVCTSCSSPSCM